MLLIVTVNRIFFESFTAVKNYEAVLRWVAGEVSTCLYSYDTKVMIHSQASLGGL